jgi:predicted RNA-binding Zn-ribbon protein involved in translation (DUF1610 family)
VSEHVTSRTEWPEWLCMQFLRQRGDPFPDEWVRVNWFHSGAYCPKCGSRSIYRVEWTEKAEKLVPYAEACGACPWASGMEDSQWELPEHAFGLHINCRNPIGRLVRRAVKDERASPYGILFVRCDRVSGKYRFTKRIPRSFRDWQDAELNRITRDAADSHGGAA